MTLHPLKSRHYNWLDQLVMSFDQKLKQTPGFQNEMGLSTELSQVERRHSAGLMRINHVGEVCAQALYHGQAMTARNENLREHLLQAAKEEQEHLDWCQKRLEELNSHPSYLNFAWGTGAYLLGLIAGLAGDAWSLGFVAETEKQVADHLAHHLNDLPLTDEKSREIVAQMREDELKHQDAAQIAGANELPQPIPAVMQMMANVMRTLAYWI